MQLGTIITTNELNTIIISDTTTITHTAAYAAVAVPRTDLVVDDRVVKTRCSDFIIHFVVVGCWKNSLIFLRVLVADGRVHLYERDPVSFSEYLQ